MIMQYVVVIERPKDYGRLEAIKVSKNAYLAKRFLAIMNLVTTVILLVIASNGTTIEKHAVDNAGFLMCSHIIISNHS